MLTIRIKQFDFGTPVTQTWKEDDLPWQRLEGPSQVCNRILPAQDFIFTYFKFPNKETEDLVARYTSALSTLSGAFLRAVAECLSLPQSTFETFLGNMHRLKFIKYPRSEPGSQGVGPHKDSTGLFTFLSQDSVGGLEVLNRSEQWISAPYIEGTFIVNVQQGFEAITGGLCPATTHRVIVSLPHLFVLSRDSLCSQCTRNSPRNAELFGVNSNPQLVPKEAD